MFARGYLIVGAVLGSLLFATAPALAQLTVNPELPSGEAFPGGAPVTVPVSIEYECNMFLLVTSPEITVAAELENASGTATVEDGTLEPMSPPDCPLNESKSVRTNITVTLGADVDALAGDSVTLAINASATNTANEEVSDEADAGLEVGSLVIVTYDPGETARTADQGDLVTIDINATSASNAVVNVKPEFPDWNLTETPPDVVEVTLNPPGGSGESSATVSIPFEVPSDAEPGSHEFTVRLVATSEDGRVTQTENITYTLTVERTGGGGDNADSPGPAFPLVVLAVALVVVLRRRR
ncbi:MAG: hypothetical protein KY455_06695 [Euryarchaeota archaeon]|nr:hypothetical protein [Euryarchaeota archaeon]